MPSLPAARTHLDTLFSADPGHLRGAAHGDRLQKLSSELLETAAADLTTRISREAQIKMQRIVEPAKVATRPLSLQQVTLAQSLEQRLQSLEFLRQALDSSPARSSLHVGYASGDFFLIAHGAESSSAQIATPPDHFFSSRQIGLTLAKRSGDRHAVAGADILLHSLGQTLARQKVTPSNELVIVAADGYALAYEDVARLLRPSATADSKPAPARLDELGVPALIPLLATLRTMAANPLAAEGSSDTARGH